MKCCQGEQGEPIQQRVMQCTKIQKKTSDRNSSNKPHTSQQHCKTRKSHQRLHNSSIVSLTKIQPDIDTCNTKMSCCYFNDGSISMTTCQSNRYAVMYPWECQQFHHACVLICHTFSVITAKYSQKKGDKLPSKLSIYMRIPQHRFKSCG